MFLMAFFEWLQATPVGSAIRASGVLIALVEGVHLVGLALVLGTVLMVDLSLLGRGIRGLATPYLARQLSGWTVAGLAILLISGPLMLTSEAERLYRTPAFWVKMALLAAALLFHFTVHRKTALEDQPRRPGVVAAASLVLWFGVALAAKAIAIFPALEH